MERNRRKMLASVGWDLTGFRHWRSQCHEIDRRSMSVAVIASCNGWIDFQCVVLKVCGKIMREWLSWWSTTLPRLGSRVRVPSRALKNKKKDIQKRISFFLFLGQGPVLHWGVFRWSEKRNFGEQINHLLFGWLEFVSVFSVDNCLQQENGEQG